MSLRLALELERTAYAPGESVRGTVRVLEGGRSRSLSVSLLFRERTADYGEVARRVDSGPLHTGALADGAAHRFDLRLPPDALPGVRSPNGELFWEVDAKSDELGRDTHATQRIEVAAPRGQRP